MILFLGRGGWTCTIRVGRQGRAFSTLQFRGVVGGIAEGCYSGIEAASSFKLLLRSQPAG